MSGRGYDAWKTDDTALDREEAVSWQTRRTPWLRCTDCNDPIVMGTKCAACWHHELSDYDEPEVSDL